MNNRLPRKKAVAFSSAFKEFLLEERLSSGFNTQRIFDAWDTVSGAAAYTTNRFFRDGVLYITTNSSMVKSHLQMQSRALVRGINDHIASDELFVKEDPNVGLVKKLVIK